MKLILLRHGNTFEPGEKPRFIGSLEDLPLTEYGRAQGQLAANLLIKEGLQVKALYCSSLKRTIETATIIKEQLNLKSEIVQDQRLLELDYGAWSNLTDDQVDPKELSEWRDYGLWPQRANFSPSFAQIISETKEFLDSLVEPVTLAVTSNGRMRWFFDLLNFKAGPAVKTGALCILQKEKNWRVTEWNVIPGS